MKRSKNGADVFHIQPVDIEPIPGVVALCEEMLQAAKDGELRSVAFAAEMTGGRRLSSFALGDGSLSGLVFSLEKTKLRLLMRGDSVVEEDDEGMEDE